MQPININRQILTRQGKIWYTPKISIAFQIIQRMTTQNSRKDKYFTNGKPLSFPEPIHLKNKIYYSALRTQ